MKKFLKNISFRVDVLNCMSPHLRIELTHTTWMVWEARPKFWLKACNGQCIVCNAMQNLISADNSLPLEKPIEFKIKQLILILFPVLQWIRTNFLFESYGNKQRFRIWDVDFTKTVPRAIQRDRFRLYWIARIQKEDQDQIIYHH